MPNYRLKMRGGDVPRAALRGGGRAPAETFARAWSRSRLCGSVHDLARTGQIGAIASVKRIHMYTGL